MSDVITGLARVSTPLPAMPHLPGRGTTPDRDALEAAKALCPASIDPDQWADNGAYRQGWALYDAGYWWEAHEVWERVWATCRPNSQERFLLATLIQLANARLKHRLGQNRAARRLVLAAERQATDAFSVSRSLMGVDQDALERHILKFHSAL